MELEIILKDHPEFEKFINVRIELARLNRELKRIEGHMEDLDHELFRMSDEKAIEQSKATGLALRDRRRFLRMVINRQGSKVEAVTRNYLNKSIVGILRNRPVAEYRKFINICSDSLNHEAIGETEMEEFTKDVLFAFAGKE